jgi:methylenetetrahydrofolate reductase (NADPH)
MDRMMDDDIAMPAESGLARAIRAGHFALTAEFVPPVSGAPEPILAAAAPFKGIVDAVNVTDGPRAQVHTGGIAAAALMLRAGVEPTLQVTCRDRNRIALQMDLLGASALGVRNVLMMTGDPPEEGEGQPKPVFDLDTNGLIALASSMREGGALPSGRMIAAAPKLMIGATDMPVDPEPGWKPAGMLARIEAGARFFQTQLCYDIGMIRRYAGALNDAGVPERAAVLVGIGPLASARSARWMRDNLFGVVVPDALIERLDAAADQKAEGIAICAELMAEMAEIDGVGGAHLMAPSNPDSIPDAVALARLGPAFRG